MSVTLNSVETGDTYREHTTLDAPGTRRINLQVVSGGQVVFQLGHSLEPGIPPFFDGTEVGLPAGGFMSIDRSCDGIRVRSANPGEPGIVTLECVRKWEL